MTGRVTGLVTGLVTPRVNGADLARRFHHEVVEPLVRGEFGDVPLVAGRFGGGSDVLGHDDDVSADHDWGLRTTLLVPAGPPVARFLQDALPAEFAGHPVRFPTTWDGSARHRVEVATVEDFVRARLGVGPQDPWSVADWLSFTGQAVLELRAGPVFADDEGRWEELRRRLTWYPDDVWRYLVASAWKQLEQELPFVGRTGSRGDDLGSRVIAARLGEVAVRLGLLLDRTWAPYAKWLGTAAAAAPGGRVLPALSRALRAQDWREREDALCAALEDLLAHQRDVLGGPARATGPFHDRPFRGVVEHLAEDVLAPVTDPAVRALPLGAGSVEGFVRAVDVLVRPDLRRALAAGLTDGTAR
ncbi:DUF4037 domain-containing protein [Kineococcus rhizosphaerae]|uniref:Uncharacterized protein DUF4037 n=1 Tax=Kineococcus rhizosphaerae TaxID=559628 RepID=A0A2T0R305_9ACTN|nr:DUF4037 domain-containing protein [Kineococcus rhizosphaerae]PRY14447.1 uncharacterized protein DUF4037 [Kineococcus rhizosphaerae]